MRAAAGFGLLMLAATPGCAPPRHQLAAQPPPVVAPAPVPIAAAGQMRMPMTLEVPLIGAPPRAVAEPAPVPNREIEAPPDRITDPRAARVEPMVLAPERRQGMTFGGEHLRDGGSDRGIDMPGVRLPLDNLVPGARVRIPFE